MPLPQTPFLDVSMALSTHINMTFHSPLFRLMILFLLPIFPVHTDFAFIHKLIPYLEQSSHLPVSNELLYIL